VELVPGVALPGAVGSGVPELVLPVPGADIAPPLAPIVAFASVHCPLLPAVVLPVVPTAPVAPVAAPPRCKQPETVTVRLFGLPVGDVAPV
jgi:hypothetical protein